MWRKAFSQPGGIGAVVCGIIAWNVAWYFDFGERAIWLCGVAGYITATFMMWMDMMTNRLWRIEEKLDDIESKLDTPNDGGARMSMKDHSGDPKSPDSEKTQPSDLCVKGARNVKRWLCGIGTIEVLTFVLAFAAGIQLWGYITSERALVFAENVTLPRGLKDVDPLVMQLEIKNGGKSPATIQSVAAAITHRLPPRPQYGGASKFAFPPAVPGAVVKRPLRFDVSGGYNTEMVERLKSGDEKLYLFGVIRYSDWANFPAIFGFKETGFCFIYAASGSEDGFETCEEPAYTYAN